MRALGLVLVLLASVARAQLAGNPLAAAGNPTITGTATFLTDPQFQASINAGDIVCNGVGTNAGICHGGTRDGLSCVVTSECTGGGICGFTGYRVQMDRPQSVSGTPAAPAQVGRQFISGWSFDPTNRSAVLEFVGNGTTGSKQYLFLNGHLDPASSFASPSFTSASAGTFGIESTDTTLALVTAPAGTSQTPIRALTVTTAGVPVPPSLAEPLPTCAAAIQGAQVFDTTLATKQLCVCNAVPRWCATSVPGCTTGTTTVCGTT